MDESQRGKQLRVDRVSKDAGGKGHFLPTKFFVPVVILMVAVPAASGWYVWNECQQFEVHESHRAKMFQLSGRVSHFEEVLTMSARMAAATGDPQWERRYGEFEPQLYAAIKEVTSLAPETLMSKVAAQMDAANVRLVEMEKKAFGLVREGDPQAAMAILNSAEYAEQKRIYSEGVKDFTEGLQTHTHAELRRHRRHILIAASFATSSALLLLFVWVVMLQQLKYTSEIRSSEKALRKSDARYKRFFADTAIGFYRTSPDGRILEANPALVRMLGYSSFEELAQRNLDKEGYEPRYSRSEFKERIEREGQVVGLESAWVKRDGTTVFIIENSRAIRDEDGNTLYYEGTAEEITERKKAVETLQKSEENYKTLTANIPGMVFRAKSDWSVDFVSNSESLCGYSPQEFYERQVSWLDIVHPEDKEKAFREGERLAERRGSLVQEYRIITKSGDTRWVEDHKTSSFSVGDDSMVIDGIVFDITNRKKADEEVNKFKTIAEKAGYGVGMLDIEYNLIYVNESYANMHGYRIDELIGKNLSIFHSEEQMERVNRLNERLARVGSFLGEEVWHKRKDDTTFPTLMNGTLIRDENGNALFMAVTAIDTTERKRAEDASRLHNLRLKALLDLNKMARASRQEILDFVRDKALEITQSELSFVGFLNGDESLYTAYAWSHEVMKQCAITQPPREFPIAQAGLWAEAVRQRKPIIINDYAACPHKKGCPKGHVPITKVLCVPIFDGEHIAMVAAVANKETDYDESDVHALTSMVNDAERLIRQDRIEQALRESEGRYRVLVESADEVITTIDGNGVFLFMNRFGAERLGGKQHDYIGKTMWDVFPEEFADRHMMAVRNVIDSGQGTREVVLANIRGRLRWYAAALEPLRNELGEIVAVLIIARDVHEAKQAREQLDKYREEMVRAEQLASLGTLSATIAHELSQPLTTVGLSLGNSLAALKATSGSKALVEELEQALAGLYQVNAIVSKFRGFSKISSDKTVEQVDLKVVAQRIVTLLTQSAQEAKVALEIQDMEELPSICSSKRGIGQLFFALAENAIQAADGKKNRRLVISGAEKDEHIELRFSDTCGGIPAGNLERIFEPFFTTGPTDKRTGLGLCVVERILAGVGGKIRVESKADKGSTFFVTLPVRSDTKT